MVLQKENIKMMHVNEQGTAQVISKTEKTNKKWKEEIKYCPACYQAGAQTQLKLYQINMDEAVYLCPNYLNCLYPQVNGWQFVNRSIDEMVSDVESDDDDEDNSKPDIHEVENLIQKMQSNYDNISLDSVFNSPQRKTETSMSMLFNEIDSQLTHIEEKVVENINENNRILLEMEDKSNYIDNDLLDDLDNLLSGCNDIETSPPSETEVSNEPKTIVSEILLPPNNTQNDSKQNTAFYTTSKYTFSETFPNNIENECNSIAVLIPHEIDNTSKNVTIVTEKLLSPNSIELPNDIQNESKQNQGLSEASPNNIENECNSVELSIQNEIPIDNVSKYVTIVSETLLPPNNIKLSKDTQNESKKNQMLSAPSKFITSEINSFPNKSEIGNVSKRVKIVSETLLSPNNIRLPLDTESVSTECFTVECTPQKQISLKTIERPQEAGATLHKNLIKTRKTQTTKSETVLTSKKNVRKSLRKTKNELPAKMENFQCDLRSKSSSNLKCNKRNGKKMPPPEWKTLPIENIKTEEENHLRDGKKLN